MNKVFIRSLLFLFLVFLCVYLLVNDIQENKQVQIVDSVKSIQIGEKIIRVRLAITPREHEKGLSGVTSLAPDEGMLFVFENSDKHYFWMKGMEIPIDIIWIDEFEKIVFFKENIKPETYPEIFGPEIDSKYVLEVASGFVKENDIVIGDRLFFLP